jgi:hypothetical protein
VVAAEVMARTNDQPHFVPMATSAVENLTEAGHRSRIGVFVADAGYWSAANATSAPGALVLIATRKSAWRTADKPDDDKLAVLARVNRGELSQRQAGAIPGGLFREYLETAGIPGARADDVLETFTALLVEAATAESLEEGCALLPEEQPGHLAVTRLQ